ncbi:MAG: polysaccharide biosynthesis/export family protein [Proteobacteria bacterium]|nr:polysaccharide biosynthesis/export family protein [Pseudomonadota bacterium]
MKTKFTIFRVSLAGSCRMAIAMVLLSGMMLACAAPPPPPPPETVPGERRVYVIGVTDVLGITVWKNPELSTAAPVRPDGKISVPLLDDVQAEGLTPQELKEVLTEALSEFIAAPDVTVSVREMNSQAIYLLGEGVQGNGALSLRKEMRVLEAIATMGGFTIWAKKNNIRILRKTQSGITEYSFNYGAYMAGKAPNSNIVLQAGDTIVVGN